MIQSPDRCPICDSSSIRKRPFHYRFHEGVLQGFSCRRCGIIFIHPQPSPAELESLYSAEYFEGGDVRCGHVKEYSASLDNLVDRGVLFVVRSMKQTGRFLEVGCAGGATLHAAREMGYETEGVELSSAASQMAREKFGLRVFTGTVAEARFPDSRFDIVYMGDVLEHLPNPRDSLREIFRIMAPGGLLAVAVPTQTNTLFSRTGFALFGPLGKSAEVQLPPYHLFEYRPASLRFLLHTSGFRVQKIQEGIIPPGEINLRGSLTQQLGKKLFHYPNWVLTRALHVCGDRLTAFAVKE